MNEFGLRQEDLLVICGQLSRFETVESAVIFGSRAKGNFKNGSDVDIALFGSNLDFRDTSAISESLNEETPMPWFFDVFDYKSIESDELRSHIDRVGKVIYTRKPA